MNTDNNGFVKMWDNWSKRRSSVPVYDLWLDDYKDILEHNKDNEILDLGCGTGALLKEIKELIEQRKSARENKEWELSDKLRDRIIELGYLVKDTKNGMEVEKA